MSAFTTEWKLAWDATVRLHAEVEDFRFMFADELRFALMKETAPGFFGRLRTTMWNGMLLQVCKLTDPAKTRGKSNLSLAYLLSSAERDFSHDVMTEAANLVQKAQESSVFARNWRNSRIAHRDLSNATGETPCLAATLADVSQAAKAIGAAVDALRGDGMSTHWEAGLYKRDTEMMLDYLSEGRHSQSAREKAYVEGKLAWGTMWWDAKE